MKKRLLLIFCLLLTIALYSNTVAQDITQSGLPEGAMTRLGKGGINIMRFSPDGKYLAVGTDVGVWLYDVATGDETALFTGLSGQVNALTFSQDGTVLASSGYENPIIQMWNLSTGEKRNHIELKKRSDSISALKIKEKILISIDRIGNLTYFNVDTGQELTNSRDISFLESVAFSEDGNVFALGVRGGRIHLWDATSVKKEKTLLGHANLFKRNENKVNALTISPDGRFLASGSEDKTVQLWDLQNHKLLTKLRGHRGWVTSLAYSTDGEILASGDASNTIKLWDIKSRKLKDTLIGHNNTINALAFVPEGTEQYSGCLASGSADGTIRFWNPDTAEEITIFTTGHTEWVKALAFSENDTTLASAVFNGTVELWSLQTMQELTSFTMGLSDAADSVKLSPNAKYFVCRRSKGMIAFNSLGYGMRSSSRMDDKYKIWEIASGNEVQIPIQQRSFARTLPAFSPNSGIIAANDHQGISILHLETGTELFRIKQRQSIHRGQLVFSHDGKIFAAFNNYDKPQIWDVTTQKEITPHGIDLTEILTFSPNGNSFATVNRQSVKLWKLDENNEYFHTKLTKVPWRISEAIIFSPDGKVLLGTDRKLIKLISVETGKFIGSLLGHTEPIETLVFSHNGKTLASGSQDGTIMLWDWEKVISDELYDHRLR